MSKPSIGSEPLMKTPIRICWPFGPLKMGGEDGHGEEGFADVGSRRQTMPVAACTRGISSGDATTIVRSRMGKRIRIFIRDNPTTPLGCFFLPCDISFRTILVAFARVVVFRGPWEPRDS